ncbi:hypothetical protein ACFPIJ_54560 [Dactylosporangium cerinum]|uniref:Serine/arginine repetitive matrix protein 2 n=1 Tax=Dactylosporangium cerinum TaxID=1434730 RepID=A0ABV9WDI2_9ACTN
MQPSAHPAPSRRPGYGPTVAAAVAGVLIAVVVLVVGIGSWVDDFPDLETQFQPGETVPVTLAADRPSVIYVSPTEAAYADRCAAELPGGTVAITESKTFTFLSGGRGWAARYELLADRDGTARLTCPRAGSGVLLAVGEQADNPALLRKLSGTIGFALVLGLAGIVTAVVLGMRTARRRRELRT